jgi:hypothetical protein
MSDTETTTEEPKYCTRRAGVKLANARGIPLTVSRTNKDSMVGRGPRPAGRYGRADIYEVAEFMRYATERALLTDTE